MWYGGVITPGATNRPTLNPRAPTVARILIVDDVESDRLISGAILEQAGHDTFFAEDGQQALGVFGGTEIDVVITDLQMPRADGLELISILRDVSPRPGIIALSGTGYDQLDMARAVGADATLTKPVDPEELLTALAMTVNREE